MKLKDLFYLALLTLAGLMVQGYHPGSEDSETYLPGIERMLHPELFPTGSPYFLLHAHLTFFPNLIAASVRLTHLPLAWALLIWHLAAIFLFLAACLSLMRRVFGEERAVWCGMVTITALLTLSVAGTALAIMDQYINPRNLIAFAVVMGVVRVLDRKYLQSAVFLLFAAALHPFMAVFAVTFTVLLAWMERSTIAVTERSGAFREAQLTRAGASLLPFALYQAPSAAYEQVAGNHRYQFLVRWHWYELLGAVAPLAILYGFSLVARARRMRNLDILSRSLILYGAFYFLAGLVVSIPPQLAAVARLQPMRSLYLLYILFFLFAGGLVGQFLLRDRVWRWALLFLPLTAGMFIAQRNLFPASRHIEWPWQAPRNPWAQAFVWIRENTPVRAIFALDPYYMWIENEDAIGFRAVAERSQLADGIKDSGVVEMFPQIGDQWLAEVDAQKSLDTFNSAGFARLQSRYGVSWVVLRKEAQQPLACPYQNAVVKVCRLEAP